jgi:hypothetical protein
MLSRLHPIRLGVDFKSFYPTVSAQGIERNDPIFLKCPYANHSISAMQSFADVRNIPRGQGLSPAMEISLQARLNLID